MKARILIRLALILGIAGLFLLYEVPLTKEGPSTSVGEAPRPPPDDDRRATFVSPVLELPAAGAPALPEDDPRLAKLDPEQAAKLAPVLDAMDKIIARAQANAAGREGAAMAPQGEPVPEETPPAPFPTDREGIQAAIRTALPAVKECYEAWLLANPELEGKLTVAFEILPDHDDPTLGVIDSAKVQESGLGNAFLDGCVVASLGDLVFEAPADGKVSVTYPFRFEHRENP
ncbi:MAG: AgmX/PglI C-terminal domain-containing protein [Deltaproteobacteria bacterium]|nr:AgmX/PglI C-terminal domain-containing protein [Deltaproteobacteria bacterium]